MNREEGIDAIETCICAAQCAGNMANSKSIVVTARAYLASLKAESDKPFAWMTRESVRALFKGGNGSRGTVPVHIKKSATACVPLYAHPPTEWQPIESIAKGDRAIVARFEGKRLCWASAGRRQMGLWYTLNGEMLGTPTHAMPLPPSPAKEKP